MKRFIIHYSNGTTRRIDGKSFEAAVRYYQIDDGHNFYIDWWTEIL